MGKNRRPLSSFERFQSFVDGLWDGSSIRLGAELSRADKVAHFSVLVLRSFARNRCPIHAYALSYTTLLALVPMLAVVLSLTSGMLKGESEERIGQFIDQLVMAVVPSATAPTNVDEAATAPPPPTEVQPARTDSPIPANASGETNAVASASTNAPTAAQVALATIAAKPEVVEVRKEAARKIREFIQNTWSGTMGAAGLVLLLYIAITMLARIEDTFNDIWGVAHGRTWFMRIVLYWAVISLVPLLLMAALTLATGSRLAGTREFLTQMPIIGNLMFQLLPLLMLWLTFSAFYKLVPNTRIDWTAALAGGGVCAILWHMNNAFSTLYVSRVVTNSKIYGSLGLVPVFMVGLYFSWFFLLLGAQFAYAWQNRAAYLQEKLAERVDQRGREFVALRLMAGVGQYFQSGEAAASIAELSATLGVPSRLTQQIMRTLQAAQLVSEVAGKEVAYLPARPLETITCHDILLAMRTTHGQPLPKRDEPATNEVLGEFERIQEAERAAAASVTLLALVNRAQARLRLSAPASAGDIAAAPAQSLVEKSLEPRSTGFGAPPSGGSGGKPAEAGTPNPGSQTSSQVLPAEPVSGPAVAVAPTAKPEPPANPAVPAAPTVDFETAAPATAPTVQKGSPEFVSIQLPTTTQPTQDEERSFPL